MKAWLLCESCVHAELSHTQPRNNLVIEWRDCAKSCFAVVSKLVSEPENMGDLVFDCLLHCRQCAAICEKYASEPDIELCGDVCNVCGDLLRELTPFSLN